MFTVYIYVCVLNRIHVLHVETVSYIYIYTTSNAGFQIYIANNIYIYNYKCKMLASRTRDFKYILSATFWTFLWKGLSRKHVPSTSFPALAEFSPTPVQIVSLYIVTRNKDFRNSDLLYILHHFLCFGSAALAYCTLTSCFLARRSFGSCDRIFYID